ncbi:PC3-like endoprotease variant B [Protopterus annectens]|uniref:PC3-like endoprotease variant B n=1 Tax=Protopterus annectens TaxID=7888 RepID=UPI001CFA7333|nr:PC3-like endoprotease variant B [Protopterus annectens]
MTTWMKPLTTLNVDRHGDKNDATWKQKRYIKEKIRIRLLDGQITDAMEAAALSYNNQYIDIYSCCWGPEDDGKQMNGPMKLASKALEEGVEKGRDGKGSIFIWASGNGGLNNDHCGADGYVNSIYTVAIGSVNNYGLTTFYSEACSAMMAVVPTGAESEVQEEDSPDLDQVQLVTTEMGDGCTRNFEGTSSAAPLAAGVIALVLQANNYVNKKYNLYDLDFKYSREKINSVNWCEQPCKDDDGIYCLLKSILCETIEDVSQNKANKPPKLPHW